MVSVSVELLKVDMTVTVYRSHNQFLETKVFIDRPPVVLMYNLS